MKLKSLSLDGCEKLTGKPGCAGGGAVKCCLRATPEWNLPVPRDAYPAPAKSSRATRPPLGEMSPLVFVLILEGKANLKGCDTLELPSSDAMNQASPDVIDRLHAIKVVDLTKNKIGFSVAGRERQYIRVARGAEQQTGVA